MLKTGLTIVATTYTNLRIALVVRWHTEAPLEVVKAEYWQMLEAAVAQGMNDWLLDVRRRNKVPAELSAWVNSTFYPETVAQMAPRRLRLAVLNSPFMTQLYTSDPVQQREVAYALDPARPFNIALFEDEGKAMKWLQPMPER